MRKARVPRVTAAAVIGSVASTRTISTTAPLTGGGTLAADRTLAISNFTGDAGAGGAKGAVPAPAAGDAAAGKVLGAGGGWVAASAGSGDVVGPAASVASEVALFDGTTGKLIKRATTTGIAKLASGVLSAAVSGTDYEAPGTMTAHLATGDPHTQYALESALGDAASLDVGAVANTVAAGDDSRFGKASVITESSGPTNLTVGAIADGQSLRRVGSTIVGFAVLLSQQVGVGDIDMNNVSMGSSARTTVAGATFGYP